MTENKDTLWLMLFILPVYLFIFWLFCEWCEWSLGKSFTDKLREKKRIAITSLIALLLFAGVSGYVGYKLKKPIILDECLTLINWEQKYNNEIAQKEEVFKQHPRMRKYFK